LRAEPHNGVRRRELSAYGATVAGDRWTERELVLERYAKSASRGTTIYEFRSPERDWSGYALDWIDWNPTWTAVDAGCGLGAYFPALRRRVPAGVLIGIDVTLVELEHTAALQPGVPLAGADVQAVPLREASVDAIVCAHMLYHVPDVAAALREFRRVLRPGGTFLAIYDSEVDDQRELDDLFMASGGTVPLNRLTARFSIESGPGYLEPVFDDVVLHTERPAMLVPEVDPVTSEIDGLRAVAEPYLEPGVTWDGMLARAAERVVEVIERDGVFRISEHKGVFVCR